MSQPQKSRNLGLILILGGITIGAITLGGYYMSRNPGEVADLFRGSQSLVNTDILETTLTASPSCAGVPVAIFKSVCAKKNGEPVPSWSAELDEPSQMCLGDSFRNTTLYEMEYRREPKDNYQDYDNNLGVIQHACDVIRDMSEKDYSDAAMLLNAWYKKHRADMKSVHE